MWRTLSVDRQVVMPRREASRLASVLFPVPLVPHSSTTTLRFCSRMLRMPHPKVPQNGVGESIHISSVGKMAHGQHGGPQRHCRWFPRTACTAVCDWFKVLT